MHIHVYQVLDGAERNPPIPGPVFKVTAQAGPGWFRAFAGPTPERAWAAALAWQARGCVCVCVRVCA